MISAIRHRVRQGLVALAGRPEEDEAVMITQWLTDAQAAAFRALPAHDRGHLVRVAKQLVRDPSSADLVIAGLLHDLGKVDGATHVRWIDRVIVVGARRVAPKTLARATSERHAWWPQGYLAVHHARLGSERARHLGCSNRTCWLILHHELTVSIDADLNRLIAIDHSTP